MLGVCPYDCLSLPPPYTIQSNPTQRFALEFVLSRARAEPSHKHVQRHGATLVHTVSAAKELVADSPSIPARLIVRRKGASNVSHRASETRHSNFTLSGSDTLRSSASAADLCDSTTQDEEHKDAFSRHPTRIVNFRLTVAALNQTRQRGAAADDRGPSLDLACGAITFVQPRKGPPRSPCVGVRSHQARTWACSLQFPSVDSAVSAAANACHFFTSRLCHVDLFHFLLPSPTANLNAANLRLQGQCPVLSFDLRFRSAATTGCTTLLAQPSLAIARSLAAH